ncbi:prepilin-type N-terminal cleavage/methylation domain-containing protein [Lampropedia puyangensis]|uniref:Prepilin-type N-terminal cleavage/methylation domain-containing protein n=1 Tax=Lampropedia puyangensis TaxID=1330072 RepID=A0A4S8FFC2_9BURK|nr:prepilin-type N-terminal cleavage/methylation domain-containing protein [Lampropedia puyangensis]THU04562.1 prepilin-type N-terminal cleavage/methylation domain-containing protein [Lampropedia puyangensis]
MASIPLNRNGTTLAQRPTNHGFTLIEVMVAIALMAVMAAVSWRGIDALVRAQSYTQRQATEQSVLQTSMMQWQNDLEHMSNILALTPMDWDGKVFRITRESTRIHPTDAPSVVVVAWSDRLVNDQKYWLRWQSAPIASRAQWRQAWAAAQLWSQGQGGSTQGQEIALLPIIQWQLYYARGGHWSNPLSSTEKPDTGPPSFNDQNENDQDNQQPQASQYTAPNALFALPDGIRLQIDLASGQAFSGPLTRDWLVPTFGMTR